jgi:hypothetical protein
MVLVWCLTYLAPAAVASCRTHRCPRHTCHTHPAPGLPLLQQAAATPLTPLAGPLKPHPSPLRRRGYFTDMHGGGAFARMPSLFARADERSSKLMSAGTTLPTVGCLRISWQSNRRCSTASRVSVAVARQADGGAAALPPCLACPAPCRRSAPTPAPHPPRPARTSSTAASRSPSFR